MVTKSHTIHNIKNTVTQMHTHFSQLYIAGNFPYLTDVVRTSGREWVPTHPYSPSEPYFLTDYPQS